MKIIKKLVIGGNATVVRHINRSTVLNIIREQQPISRSKITKIIGLNKGTISRIVKTLLQDNFIYEESCNDKNVGRRPILLSLKKAVHFVGAISINSDTTRIAVFDIDVSVIKTIQMKTDINIPGDYFESCAQKLRELQQTLKIPKFEGIGVSLPAITDSNRGKIIISRNLKIDNIYLGKYFQKYFPNVNIKFENNANAAALAEMWFGVAKTYNIDDFVFLCVGIGIGTGIIINKRLWRGDFYSAGEFGRMITCYSMDPNRYEESINLEGIASDPATIERYGILPKEEQYDTIESKMSVIIQKAKKNDASAIKVLKEKGQYIGIGVTNIIQTIDPKAVIVGGKIVEVWDIVYPEILKIVEKYIYQFRERGNVIFPTYNNGELNPALVGAATLPIMDLFANYSITL